MTQENNISGSGRCVGSTPEALFKTRCDNLGILTEKPRYRHYNTVHTREASFENWPSTKTQSVRELAEAGFGYTGVEDAVRCFFCGIGLKDWPDSANPWEQHTLANPDCVHVRQCKGAGYIRKLTGKVDRDADNESDDIDDSRDVIDIVQVAINRNKESVTVARDFCRKENLVRTGIKTLIRKDLQKRFTATELIKVIQEIEDRTEEEKATAIIAIEDDSDVETDGEESETENTKELLETNKSLKDPITCKICFDAIACIITLPCGHMVSCPQCIAALNSCAVCRAEIKGTVRALMAV